MSKELEVDEDYIQQRRADELEQHPDVLEAEWARMVAEETAHRKLAELQRRLAELEDRQNQTKG
jgi:hypothetical protein